MMHHNTYTVESVTAAHPDKMCDQISDAILDAYLRQDPRARVAVETFGVHDLLVVGGEVTSEASVDAAAIAQRVYNGIGYKDPLRIEINIIRQSPDIAQGVDTGGAGDQGCLKKGTLVRLKRGFVPIQEVKKGDEVITPHGWRKVLHSAMTGKKKTVEIICTNGMSLECTPDHKILCYDRKGHTYWRSAATLHQGEFICTLKPGDNYSYLHITSVIPRSNFFGKYNHKIFGPERITLDTTIAYLTGELIGDGYVRDHRLMEVAFGNNYEHALAVQKVAASVMPNQWRWIEGKSGSVSLKIDSLLARKHFANFGVLHATAHQKETPTAIFQSPYEVVAAYIRGLFDSDGTIVAGTGRKSENIRIRLSSSSLHLLRQTQLLLNDFGIKSVILLNRRSGTPVGKIGRGGRKYTAMHDNYVLSIIGFDSYRAFCEKIGFLDMRKQTRVQEYLAATQKKPRNSRGLWMIPHPCKDEMVDEQRIGRQLSFGISVCQEVIKREDKVEVYDLEIEGSHIFSGNGIFVHNSMFGYATDETPEFVPRGVALVHRLARGLEELRIQDPSCSWLQPEGRAHGKTQVTINDGRIKSVLVSCQHDESVSQEEIREQLIKKLIGPIIGDLEHVEILVNPTGKFIIGGFVADTGLTGRKIMVDTYGGLIPHGGGAFSGKDPTKVDRSGAYMARFAAKNLVANGYAKKCLVSVAYAIGRAEPLMIHAAGEDGKNLSEVVRRHFDFRPTAIIERLGLRRPLYQKTAAYGHFGREGFPWEEIVKI